MADPPELTTEVTGIYASFRASPLPLTALLANCSGFSRNRLKMQLLRGSNVWSQWVMDNEQWVNVGK